MIHLGSSSIQMINIDKYVKMSQTWPFQPSKWPLEWFNLIFWLWLFVCFKTPQTLLFFIEQYPKEFSVDRFYYDDYGPPPHVSSNPHPLLESQLTKIIIAEDWFQWSVISEAYRPMRNVLFLLRIKYFTWSQGPLLQSDCLWWEYGLRVWEGEKGWSCWKWITPMSWFLSKLTDITLISPHWERRSVWCLTIRHSRQFVGLGCFREHVIRSTCDENVNQLTLGVGGVKDPATLSSHKIDLWFYLRFFHRILTAVETDFSII